MIISSRGRVLVALLGTLAAISCGRVTQSGTGVDKEQTSEQKVEVKPTVVNQSPVANETIIDASANSVTVLGGLTVRQQLAAGKIAHLAQDAASASVAASIPGAAAADVKDDSLYIQLPKQLLAQGHLFGGVITSVSDRENENLGRLKLTDLPAIHVRPYVANLEDSKDKLAIVLLGCMQKCSESSAQEPIIGLPIVGQSADGDEIIMDVSKFGETLDLMSVFDPGGEYTGLKTIATRTTAVDMSDSTIVWEVEHKMIPKTATDAEHAPVTLIGARYYLKLESSLNSAFQSRKQTDGVGFFTTANRAEELITRFSQTEFNGKPIHYFIKNVPEEHKAAFAASFDNWNKTFSDELSRELITYEFVAADDPKAALLIPGDPRFNILEWDLVNKAPYGGLGPSMASQNTGEIFSANVLVQGPTIIDIYKEWFKVAAAAKQLVADGKKQEADAMIIAARRKIFAKIGEGKELPKMQLSLGSAVKFQHRAQDERLQDRVAARQDFFDTPAGETYESYMHGYFIDMVTHELGHNMGLRHNFKGNLLATADGSKPSGSVMEYLNREFRHKDSIGEYDHIAIKYGYAGVEPARKDIFCTDENVVDGDNPTFSAECSRDDATKDPFAYLGRNLDRALDRIVDPTTDKAPTWIVADLSRELNIALTGRIVYATSAEATSKTWLDWAAPNRPRRSSAISQYVFNTMRDQLCAPAIRKAADKKATEEAKTATTKNLADLDAAIDAVSTKFKIGTRLKCIQP